MKNLKQIVVILFVLAAHVVSFAQETEAGKKLAADFWKALEEKRLVAAESKLNGLKRREPNFDASKMEKALVDAKTQKDEARSSARASLMATVSASRNLDDLFRSRVVQADSGDTLDSITTEIAKYAKMADEVAKTDRASISRDLEKTAEYLHRELASAGASDAKLVKCANDATEPKQAETCYYELLLHQSYWDNARKVLPDDTQIAAVYAATTRSVDSLGTAEQRAAKAEKNKNAKIDAERLPKAVMKDTALEKIFQNAFNAQNQGMNWEYTFLRAVVITDDYGLVRHSITGVILTRYRIGAIAFKTKDGKCKQGRFRIDQSYVGNSFSGNWRGDFADFTHEMRCENVNK